MVEDVPPEYLASVSRRFRCIMLRLPKIWSAVHIRLPPEVIYRRHERSKHHGLHVTFDVDERSLKTAYYPGLYPLVSRCHQWRSLKMSLSVSRHQEDLVREILWTGQLHLPALQSLDIALDAVDTNGTPAVYLSAQLKDWDMPALRTLRLTNFFPFFPGHERLVSCSITMDSRFSPIFEAPVVNPTQFINFLESSPNLENLSLSFSCIRTDHSEFLPHEYCPGIIELRSLRSMYFGLCVDRSVYNREHYDWQLGLVEWISAPILDTLELRFANLLSSDLHVAVSRLTKSMRDCPRLRTLSIDTRVAADEGLDILGPIFEYLPQVQHLTLEGNMVTTWSTVTHPTSLQMITLRNLGTVDTRFVRRLQGLFGLLTARDSSELFPLFARIVVQDCPLPQHVDDAADSKALRCAHRLSSFLDAVGADIIWIE